MSDNSPQDVGPPLVQLALPYPHAHRYLTNFYVDSANDHVSDSRSQSESQQQTPGGSTSGQRQQRQDSSGNPRRSKPTSLSFYRSTDLYVPLSEAQDSFAATAFASGYFFYHTRSLYLENFRTFARDAIALAASAHNST